MTPVAVLAGLLLVGGAFALVAGLRRTWPSRPPAARPVAWSSTWARMSRRPGGAAGRRRDLVLGASVSAGLVLAVVTGWTLLVVATPLVAFGLPALLRLPVQRDVGLMEALDRWLRSLAATLATGRSITDAIRTSLRTAPTALRDPLAALIARLNSRWEADAALRRFADDLDSPDADAVVAALILASRRGSVGASATLLALADSLQDQLRARRLIETERAKPYVVVRQVTVITTSTLVLVAAFNPGFFAAYGTPVGQLILVALLALYLGSLILLRRKARQRPRSRILLARQPEAMS
ncbi:MAG TPA: type II secretion system F family protein [Microlunatus sp.]|nr:type II secretion system F family protein [Microlunatus sp.]